VPKLDLPDDELAAVIATLKDVLASDRYPHAPRLDPLKAALARLEAAANGTHVSHSTPDPKPLASKGDGFNLFTAMPLVSDERGFWGVPGFAAGQ
jgi:hypothetical protein